MTYLKEALSWSSDKLIAPPVSGSLISADASSSASNTRDSMTSRSSSGENSNVSSSLSISPANSSSLFLKHKIELVELYSAWLDK